MQTDKKPSIGKLIEGPAFRDAIHIAVAPVVAGCRLAPGEEVSINSVGAAVDNLTNLVGIVDPFLTKEVNEGERFWLFLFPNTAQNLRHEWDHPAFRTPPESASESVGWLKAYAESHHMSYSDLMAAAETYVAGGCSDAVLEDDFKDYATDGVFWEHYEKVTGKKGEGNLWGCCI